MSNELKKYKVSILKENYFLISDESEEHLTKSVNLLNSSLKEIITKVPNAELKKTIVLAALRFSSELLKSIQEIESFNNHSKQLTEFIDIKTAQIENS